MVEAINQAECESCGASDNNYFQASREYTDTQTEDGESWSGIVRELSCDCGEVVTVAITPDGLVTEGPVSFEDASWNKEDENDE